MSGWTIVGSCPRCGSPVYAQSVWHGVLPPPSRPSCSCAGAAPSTITTTHTGGMRQVSGG